MDDDSSGQLVAPAATALDAAPSAPSPGGETPVPLTAPDPRENLSDRSSSTKKERYPRRGPIRWLRGGLAYAWAAGALYVSSAVYNLYVLVFVTPHSQPLTLDEILTALALPWWLAKPGTPLWVDGISVSALLALIAGYLWARNDAQAESKAITQHQRQEDLNAIAAANDRRLREHIEILAQAVAVAPPKGAPFDLTVLPTTQHFIGRKGTLDWLLGRLRADHPPAVTALRGIGGIGKSTFANEVIHRLHAEGRFEDGIAVVLCQGLSDPVVVLRKALARFHPRRDEPEATDLADLAEAARDLLGGKHTLIVLDNVEPELALKNVIPSLRTAGVTLLLTARQMLPTEVVPDADAHELELLTTDEALELFAVSLGRSGSAELTDGEHEAATRIVKAVNHHTLAVKLAGAHAHQAKRPLMKLAHELENPERAIKLPDQQTPEAVGKVFAQSTQSLLPEAHQLFEALGAFATSEFGQEAVLALAYRLRLFDPQRHVDSLVSLALLDKQMNPKVPEQSDSERLRLHPLLHAFAKMGFASWTEERRTTALKALADHYATYVNGTSSQAFAADERNIAGALEWAQDHREDDVVAKLCLGMSTFWRDRWRIPAAESYLPWGIEAATRLAASTGKREDYLQAADIALIYGEVLQNIGRGDEAESLFRANLAVRQEHADRRGEGRVRVLLGERAYLNRQVSEAEAYYKQALELLAEEKDRESLNSACDAQVYLGEIAEGRGRFDEARQYYDQSFSLSTELHNPQTETTILANRGRMALRQGKLADAAKYYRDCLNLARDNENGRAEAYSLFSLGDIAFLFGQLEEAEQQFTESLDICTSRIHDQIGEGNVLDRLGRIAQAREDLEDAEQKYQRSLAIAAQVQNPRGKGEALIDLGKLAQARGDLNEAERRFAESLAIAQQAEDHRSEGIVLVELGRLLEARGATAEAEGHYRKGREALGEAQDAVHLAAASLALGTLLARRPETRDEGCALLVDAKQRYHEMGLPAEEQAREIAQRLGCLDA